MAVKSSKKCKKTKDHGIKKGGTLDYRWHKSTEIV